jgi:inner membrane protease subunit 1
MGFKTLNFFTTLASAYIIKDQFYEISPTVGSSMYPTFDIFGDLVLLQKYKLDQIRVGDVISAKSPIEPHKLVLKRVVGKEGDVVKIDPLDPDSKFVQIPKGKLWIVGDNLRFSRDSRDYGPISFGLVHGKAIGKVTDFFNV